MKDTGHSSLGNSAVLENWILDPLLFPGLSAPRSRPKARTKLHAQDALTSDAWILSPNLRVNPHARAQCGASLKPRVFSIPSWLLFGSEGGLWCGMVQIIRLCMTWL